MVYYNNKIRITASAIGMILGMSGIFNHGLFEMLQGYKPTNGFFIKAIGEAHRFWIHGTEDAFTLIPNFLVTGIAAVLAGLAVIIWSLNYIHKKDGTTVFLLLFILLTVVGGGIGYIVLFLPAWAFATRINKPLVWWNKTLPAGVRKKLSALWKYFLPATLISWLVVMELGIFGYFPGQYNPDALLGIVFLFLFTTVILVCITFVCAVSGDLEGRRLTYRLS